MRNQVNHTDEELEEMFDEIGPGITAEDIVWTRETLSDWRNSAQMWNECKAIHDEEVEGYQAILFEGVQINPGQPRRAVVVIDFGEVRGTYNG